MFYSLLYELSRATRGNCTTPRDSATQSGILGKERSSKCLGIERTLPGVIDPRVKIATKRNPRVIATDRLGEA